MREPKYDVAISFLTADESIAAALNNALSDGLKVFFYPRRQEDLAGKDGQEAMRTPFLECRLVVVLYREPWGETEWTRVEQTAIQDGCLKDGWQRLFFMILDKTSVPPKWLPTTHIRFNYADFGLEQAVGAIKARVQEAGGVIAPLTALKRAELARQETEYQRESKTCAPRVVKLLSLQQRQTFLPGLRSCVRTLTRVETLPFRSCRTRSSATSGVVSACSSSCARIPRQVW